MLFEIPKALFADALKRIGPAIQENTDPQCKGQYLIMKGKDDAFSAWVVRQDLTALVEINSEDIKIGSEFKNTVQGKALCDVLAKTNMSGMVKAEFEASQIDPAPVVKADESDEEEDGKPAQEPVPSIGNVLLLLPSTRKQPEKLRIPAVQWTADPEINAKGSTRMTVLADELSSLVKKVEIAYDSSAPAQFKNILIRTRGAKYTVTLMEPSALCNADGVLNQVSGDFDICIGFEVFRQVVKMLVPEQTVEIVVNDGTPGTMILSQDIIYGDKVVGKCLVRISCAKEKFTPFDKKLSNLSFRYTTRFRKQQLSEMVAKLESVGGIKARFTPDTDSFKLLKRGQKGSIEELVIDAISPKGDPFEFESYSKHWKNVADRGGDEVEVSFSGKNDLLKTVLGDGYVFYFMAIGITN